MTISAYELRGASYDAADLETAFVPAAAARSILQTLGLVTRDYGVVGLTPSTGRIRVRSTKAGLTELLSFIDDVLDGIETSNDSLFLQAFPMPVEVADLPQHVLPTGLLFDMAQIRSLLDDPDTVLEQRGVMSPDDLLTALSTVLPTLPTGDEWEAMDDRGGTVARIKRLKHSFGVYSDAAKQFVLRVGGNQEVPFDRWLREENAFSLSFNSTEYFYADGALYRTGGFRREANLVRQFLTADPHLTQATSEKGSNYSSRDTRFASTSIFRVLEDSLSRDDPFLLCGDLGDEWADYIGGGSGTITFYHCKHGAVTRGASDLQIVASQALKNLSRVKLRESEIIRKLDLAQQREYWGDTQIPLLVRSQNGWPGLRKDLVKSAANPKTRWRVALVVTALSLSVFDTEARRANPLPYFIQLVWLLSSVVSCCRERDADVIIFCQP
ncbi:MAG TPA: hypothetical protein VGJ18_20685 [Gemmatimonadaceae bacterium]|jgi:hypothetical protein